MDLDHLLALVVAARDEAERTNADGPAYTALLGYLDSVQPDEDGCLLAATQEVERLRRDNERLDGVTKALAGSHARLREENEALSPLRSLLDDWRWADMDQRDIQDDDLARRIVEALAATERNVAAIRHAAGLGEG